MTAITYQCRLFGGRNCGVSHDPIAKTLSIMGQSISISTLPASLQSTWQNAIATGSPTGEQHSFGGNNIGQAIGSILDATPTWRNAVQAAINGYATAIAPYGDPEAWTH